MRLVEVIEVTATVSPAGGLLNTTVFIETTEAGVSVCLQSAMKRFQMCDGVFTLAIGRVGKPHRRGGRVACRSVVAHIGPQTPGLGLALARCQYRYRCFIAVQFPAAHYIAAQRFYQRRQRTTRGTDPIGQCRALQLDAAALVDLGLSV